MEEQTLSNNLNNKVMEGNKRYWLLNVPGVGGYSILVHCEADNVEQALCQAAEADCFIDEIDAEFAYGEEATEKDVEFFNKFKLIVEL